MRFLLTTCSRFWILLPQKPEVKIEEHSYKVIGFIHIERALGTGIAFIVLMVGPSFFNRVDRYHLLADNEEFTCVIDTPLLQKFSYSFFYAQ